MMRPETQAAGVAAASAARQRKAEEVAKAAAERHALKRQLETLPLESPEQVRDFLAVALRACATGALEARAAAACASVASRLIASFSVSISRELDELRAARERYEQQTGDTGVVRHKRR